MVVMYMVFWNNSFNNYRVIVMKLICDFFFFFYLFIDSLVFDEYGTSVFFFINNVNKLLVRSSGKNFEYCRV